MSSLNRITDLRQAALALLALAVMVATAGCGGMGLTGSEPSIYRGVWAGEWESATLQEDGVIVMTVFPDGSMIGQISNNRLHLTADIAGTMQPDGSFIATAGFGASGNYVMEGQAALGTGTLTGAYVTTYLGQEYPSTFSLTGS
jgi:hypothetical protein